jgi:cytosine deaminase
MTDKQYDLVIRNTNIFRGGKNVDLAVKDGIIVKTGKDIAGAEAAETIDGTDKLLAPGFIDSHTHIDKALIPGDPESTDLLSAIRASERYLEQVPEEKILEDILLRSRRILEMAIRNGTTALKTNVLINNTWRLKALDAMAQLREEYRDRIALFTAVPWEKQFEKELAAAIRRGQINFLGGYPSLSPDFKTDVDTIFEAASRYGLPVDIHVDESDSPNIDCFEYVLDKTIETGMRGRVTCGHVTALSAPGMDAKTAARAIEKTARAQVNITTLTSCNLFLMSGDRRGPTRVRELLEASVNVALASDNIRDPFRPFGNGDLLEEALLTAQVHKFALPGELETVFDMITYNGAKNTLLHDYGLSTGAAADMVLLDAPTPGEAIISQAEKVCVIKHGRVIHNRAAGG